MFRKRCGTADGMNVLRQIYYIMIEKRLDVQCCTSLGFVDLEKAFDTAPRETVMVVPEAEGNMFEGTYENTSTRVVVG